VKAHGGGLCGPGKTPDADDAAFLVEFVDHGSGTR
jgi:hypothetical protein